MMRRYLQLAEPVVWPCCNIQGNPSMRKKTVVFYEPSDLDTFDGVVFSPYKPTKRPTPVVTGDLPDEQNAIGMYGTVLRDQTTGLFRIWYTGIKPRTMARYAESGDGIIWRKPVVADERWVDVNCTNAVIEGQFPVVISDSEADDPLDRYRMFIWNGRMDLFRSEDGIVWQRHPARWNPVWPIETGEGLGEVPIPFWDPVRQEYIAMTRIWTGPRPKAHERSWNADRGEYIKPSSGNLRMIGRGTSPDGIFWTGPDIVYNCDDLDPLASQPYEFAAWPYADRHLGLVGILHSARHPDQSLANTLRLYLAWSTDGCYTWSRLSDRLQEFVPLGDDGDWDGGMVTQPTRLTEVDDEWWCYYGGHKNRHVASNDTEDGIGLATMPKGRLVGMTSGADVGTATTHSLQPGIGEFWVNADGRTGEVRVTLLGDDPNLPQGGSDPIVSDGVRTPVTWTGRTWNGSSRQKTKIQFEITAGGTLWECGWTI